MYKSVSSQSKRKKKYMVLRTNKRALIRNISRIHNVFTTPKISLSKIVF